MSVDWSTIKLTTEDFGQAARDFDRWRADRRKKARALEDVAAAKLAAKPCPYWADGVHCYAPGFVQGGGYFDPIVQPNLVDAKQCKCGARIRPRKVTP